jgi:EAL domain-containing protein (putative c-di-GMP-specific phosphodiesterase class I)
VVSPKDFIPIAEEIGLMESLGEWVLHEACREIVRWPGSIKLAVNVSPVQFMRDGFSPMVSKVMSETGFAARQLTLEITESLFIQDNNRVRKAIAELRATGLSFALDDFGTGYSSLNYLRNFPIDTIKIDRSFIMGVPQDKEAVAIVQAMIALGKGLGLELIAEGLETPDQIQVLQQLGCQGGQGYGLGRPQSAEEIRALLA